MFFFGLKASYFLEQSVPLNFVNKRDTKTHSDIWQRFLKCTPFILNGFYLEILFGECCVSSLYFMKHLCKYCSLQTKRHNGETNYLQVN